MAWHVRILSEVLSANLIFSCLAKCSIGQLIIKIGMTHHERHEWQEINIRNVVIVLLSKHGMRECWGLGI